MKCPVCEGKKYYYDRVEIYKRIWTPRPCPNGNCINGRHIPPRDPKKDRVGYGSNIPTHGMEDKPLCSQCFGKGCKHCEHTGMFGVPCWTCSGTGWVWHAENYKTSEYTGAQKVCLYCKEGEYSRTGSFGEMLIEHFGSAVTQRQKLQKYLNQRNRSQNEQ